LVGKIAQNALQLGAVGILQAELSRDLLGPDLPGIGADESDDGVPNRKAIVVLLLHLPTCLSGALLRRLCRCCRLGRRGFGAARDRRARLANGIRFRLAGGLLHRGLLRRLWRIGFSVGLGFRLGLGGLRGLFGLGLGAAFSCALVNQRDRF